MRFASFKSSHSFMTECMSTSDLLPRLTSVWGRAPHHLQYHFPGKGPPLAAWAHDAFLSTGYRWEPPARALLWEPGKEAHGGLTLLEDMLGAGVGNEVLPRIARVHEVC